MINATAIATLCLLSYSENGETFNEWTKRIKPLVTPLVPGCSTVHCYQSSGTEAFLAVGHPFSVLVHRGSSTVSDWMDNALAVQVANEALDMEGCKTHYGATQAGERIWQLCRDDVAGVDQSTMIIHAGHSRGGAIANDTAVRAIADGLPVYRLVTFGAPRYANPLAATLIRNLMPTNIRRFVGTTDPVPHLPLPFRYRHAGQCIYLDSDGNAHHRPTWRYKFIDQLSVAVRDWWNRGIQTSTRHSMAKYIESLEIAEQSGSLI